MSHSTRYEVAVVPRGHQGQKVELSCDSFDYSLQTLQHFFRPFLIQLLNRTDRTQTADHYAHTDHFAALGRMYVKHNLLCTIAVVTH